MTNSTSNQLLQWYYTIGVHYISSKLKKKFDFFQKSVYTAKYEPVFLVLRVWLLLVWELQVTK